MIANGAGSPAWVKGFEAFHALHGDPTAASSENEYPEGSPEYDDWNAGFEAAETMYYYDDQGDDE